MNGKLFWSRNSHFIVDLIMPNSLEIMTASHESLHKNDVEPRMQKPLLYAFYLFFLRSGSFAKQGLKIEPNRPTGKFCNLFSHKFHFPVDLTFLEGWETISKLTNSI